MLYISVRGLYEKLLVIIVEVIVVLVVLLLLVVVVITTTIFHKQIQLSDHVMKCKLVHAKKALHVMVHPATTTTTAATRTTHSKYNKKNT